MFAIWPVPVAVVMVLLVCCYCYRFQRQSERIALLAERLQSLAKKAAMPSAFTRRLRYRRFFPDSYAELRDIEKVLTRLERNYKQRTPYRLRSLTLASSGEVLDTMEKRLAKLEEVVASQESEAV